MTKNTKVWIRGLIATIVNGFASGVVLLIADPAAFNLGEGLGKLMATSTVFALLGLANYLKQHPLPDDEDTVAPSSTRMWLLPLLLVSSLAAGVSGCASAGAILKPNPTVEDAQAVRNQAAVLATATKEAATLAVDARRVAQRAYDAGAITAAQMQAINNAAIVASDKGLAFIDFAETVTTDPSLRVTATELLKVFDDFIASLSNAGQSGAAIRRALAAFIAYLGVQ